MSKCEIAELSEEFTCDDDAKWIVVFPWDEAAVCNYHLPHASEIGVMGIADAEVHVRLLKNG